MIVVGVVVRVARWHRGCNKVDGRIEVCVCVWHAGCDDGRGSGC